MIDRRNALRLMGGAAACIQRAHSLAATGATITGVRSRYVVDGNLIPPIDPAHALPDMIAVQVRSAGLTAIKLTVGGSGSLGRTGTEAELQVFKRSMALNPDLFLPISSVADLDRAAATQKLGVILSFEAAEMLEGDLANINRFRTAGVLVMGLSYNKQSSFASGVLAKHSTGLTDLGHQAVERMNRLGVTVDLSHSDERSGLEALAASARPSLVTHAGCAAVHNHPRNKSDRLLRLLAARGGVVGIYDLPFLVAPPRQPNLDDYLAHMEHALRICGEDHVGIGTDGLVTPTDLSPDNMRMLAVEDERRHRTGVAAPEERLPQFTLGLDGPNRYAVIADALSRRGYPARAVDKILGGNFVRVFEDSWTA